MSALWRDRRTKFWRRFRYPFSEDIVGQTSPNLAMITSAKAWTLGVAQTKKTWQLLIKAGCDVNGRKRVKIAGANSRGLPNQAAWE
jgi:hypothetical protein